MFHEVHAFLCKALRYGAVLGVPQPRISLPECDKWANALGPKGEKFSKHGILKWFLRCLSKLHRSAVVGKLEVKIAAFDKKGCHPLQVPHERGVQAVRRAGHAG